MQEPVALAIKVKGGDQEQDQDQEQDEWDTLLGKVTKSHMAF